MCFIAFMAVDDRHDRMRFSLMLGGTMCLCQNSTIIIIIIIICKKISYWRQSSLVGLPPAAVF